MPRRSESRVETLYPADRRERGIPWCWAPPHRAQFQIISFRCSKKKQNKRAIAHAAMAQKTFSLVAV